MTKKKDCIAMILAGGQGSRLYSLTTNIAKPAVRFGSKYRIIDFPLSNCINSGIDTVGVLTQYKPLELNDYIGNGSPWDLDRANGGVHMLPPYQGSNGGDWYMGTANAIYQNMKFIDRYDPDYVIILSGDHIYKMDYNKMLEAHISTAADCTIAVIDVPIKEASRFGIMNIRDDMSIYEFEEKPKNPKSTKASMGVYIFSKDVLFKYLTEDEADPNSSKDFGKNIIPKMLADGKKMYAYQFEGYWKDVGTISSLWEANMALLGENPSLILNDEWQIYYRHLPNYPQYIGPDASISNSLISDASEINGTVHNSVLFDDITINEGAIIKDSVIMSGCTIKEGAQISHCIIAENVVIGRNCKVGSSQNKNDITVIANGVTVYDETVIEAGTMIEK